jgi:hypothetical protein
MGFFGATIADELVLAVDEFQQSTSHKADLKKICFVCVYHNKFHIHLEYKEGKKGGVKAVLLMADNCFFVMNSIQLTMTLWIFYSSMKIKYFFSSWFFDYIFSGFL